MKIYTIGFTKKNAEQFFGKLKQAGTTRIIDTRLNNVSQLAGFTKKDDLRYLAKEILAVDYVHALSLAPTKDILDAYKKDGGDWHTYEHKFNNLIESRHIENHLDKSMLDGACLLCSEPTPHHCHRRLVAEYLCRCWGNIEIVHL
jgi:uncharacterized protein (DUF488 family)